MTHTECVLAAARWLDGKCQVVLPEFFTHNSELPDAIGFTAYGRNSHMIECKVSRGDFLKDKKKLFRQWPEQGMGNFRYYCCPKGMIKLEEVPGNWGLIYIYEPKEFDEEHALPKARMVKRPLFQNRNMDAEHHLLFYYARRANHAGVHGRILAYRGYDA